MPHNAHSRRSAIRYGGIIPIPGYPSPLHDTVYLPTTFPMRLDSRKAHTIHVLETPAGVVSLRFTKEVLVVHRQTAAQQSFAVRIEDELIACMYTAGSVLLKKNKAEEWHTYATNMVLLERGIYHIEFQAKDYLALFIFVDARYFRSLVDCAPIPHGKDNIYTVFGNDGTPTPLHCAADIVRLTQPYQPDPLRYLQLKRHALDLITESLLHAETPGDPVLKRADFDRIYAAREIIEQRYMQNLTIPLLAREVGTNEQYLKNHFKLVFGNTVYRTLLECRMRKAKAYLLQGDGLKITEIAELTGYKHATHFTSAFKKYYGYKPSRLKQKTSG